MDDSEDGRIDLSLGFERVAAVDKERRLVGEHDGDAGGTGKSGEPG